jgi:hypothetical protein
MFLVQTALRRSRRRGGWRHLLALLLAAAACGKTPTKTTATSATSTPTSTPAPTNTTVATPIPTSSASLAVSASAFSPTAKPTKCFLAAAPRTLRDFGPAALLAQDRELLVVVNKWGTPLRETFELSPLPKAAVPAALPLAAQGKATGSPCVLAKNDFYCMSREGRIRRGSDAKEIGRAHPGSRIAGATLAGHAVVAWLSDRKTTDGMMSEAWAVADEGEAIKVSDEGSGATEIDLVPRGDAIVAAYIDGRNAMTPVHARTLRVVDGALKPGKDAVVFVGGPPEPETAGVLASAKDRAFFLLPIGKNVSTFGMAAIAIDDPPKEEAPVVWSIYPPVRIGDASVAAGGLDPAPIAVSNGRSPVRIVRAVPTTDIHVRDIELGRFDEGGAFTSLGILPGERGIIAHLAIDVDSFGGVWVHTWDGSEGTVERWACP